MILAYRWHTHSPGLVKICIKDQKYSYIHVFYKLGPAIIRYEFEYSVQGLFKLC